MNAEIRSNDGNRKTVFIDNAQVVQTPQNIPLPSAIWFDRTDRIYSVMPQSLYLSRRFGYVFRGGLSYREVNLAIASVRAIPERTRQVVQSGSGVLDGIASDSENAHTDWLNTRDTIRRSALRINAANNCIWPAPYEFINLDFKIRDMMVGPFDFDPD